MSNKNFNCVCAAPHHQASPLPGQWFVKIRPGSCNGHNHFMLGYKLWSGASDGFKATQTHALKYCPQEIWNINIFILGRYPKKERSNDVFRKQLQSRHDPKIYQIQSFSLATTFTCVNMRNVSQYDVLQWIIEHFKYRYLPNTLLNRTSEEYVHGKYNYMMHDSA